MGIGFKKILLNYFWIGQGFPYRGSRSINGDTYLTHDVVFHILFFLVLQFKQKNHTT